VTVTGDENHSFLLNWWTNLTVTGNENHLKLALDILQIHAVSTKCLNYLKIWSSTRYCFRPLVNAAEDSESWPKGFSTITHVQPFMEDADLLAHLTTSKNILGGIDK
jgi:hypothetical protein